MTGLGTEQDSAQLLAELGDNVHRTHALWEDACRRAGQHLERYVRTRDPNMLDEAFRLAGQATAYWHDWIAAHERWATYHDALLAEAADSSHAPEA